MKFNLNPALPSLPRATASPCSAFAGRGTRSRPEELYSVDGTYTLSSHDEAELALYATSLNRSPSPVDPKQTVRIRKGTGEFHLVKTMDREGYLHVSFYPVPSGSDFGGIYFGQGQWVLRDKGLRGSLASSRGASGEENQDRLVSLAGANRALLE